MVPLSCQVRRELKTQTAAVGRLGSVESRLSSLEGSILSAGGCRSQGRPVRLVRAVAGWGASMLLSGGDNPKPFEGEEQRSASVLHLCSYYRVSIDSKQPLSLLLIPVPAPYPCFPHRAQCP